MKQYFPRYLFLLKAVLIPVLAVFFLCSSLYAQTRSTKSTEFWLAFIDNLALNQNGNPECHIFISADVNTSVTVSLPAFGSTKTFSVAAGTTYDYMLPTNTIYYSSGDGVYSNKGIKITSDNPVQVRAVHFRVFFSDGTIVLPKQELGDTYYAFSHRDSTQGGRSEFVVLATENNTTVTINLTQPSVSWWNANTPFTIKLNAGQTYQIQAIYDLTGSSIKSDSGKKIAVFTGATYAVIKCLATSHIYDESLPVKNWGNYYAAITFKDKKESLFKIISAVDSNIVHINCDSVKLNSGEFYSFYSGKDLIIQSKKNFGVAQYVTGGECDAIKSQFGIPTNIIGDPNLLILEPLSLVLQKKTTFKLSQPVTLTNSWFRTFYITLITTTKDTARMSLNGNPVGPFTPFSFNNQYAYARVLVDTLNQTIYSDSSYQAYAYEFHDYDAVTYSLGYTLQQAVKSDLQKDPFAALPADTVLCPGKQYVIPVKNIYIQFPDNTIKFTSTLSQPGNYVLLDNAVCPRFRHKLSLIFDTVKASLDKNLRLCVGSSHTFKIPDIIGTTYKWQDNSTADSFVVKSPGKYWVAVQRHGCSVSDTSIVAYDDSVKWPFPKDTQLCNSKTWTIDLSKFTNGVKWQDGSTALKYTISKPGLYTVNYTNACGPITGSVNVKITNADIYLGRDSTLCQGNSYTIHLKNESTSYKWNDNSTADSLLINKPGKYFVRAVKLGCAFADTIHIYYDSIPALTFPTDTALCPGEIYNIHIHNSGGTYTWQDGTKTTDYKIAKPGDYSVSVKNACGVFSKNMHVNPDSIFLKLGGPYKSCITSPVIFDLRGKGDKYQWSNGSDTSVFKVPASGTYWVIITRRACTATDSVTVKYDKPLTKFLPPDTFICGGGHFLLNPDTQDGQLTWDGNFGSQTYLVQRAGLYRATLTNACGTYNDSINVIESDCRCTVYVPNSFTPNEDKWNEQFKSYSECEYDKFDFKVYNRWGELLFETHDPAGYWDGKFKNTICPEGVYLWLINGVNKYQRLVVKSGLVTLLR